MRETHEFLTAWLQAKFSDSERGASLVEYALLVALIATVCVIAVQVFGTETSSSFSTTASGLTVTN